MILILPPQCWSLYVGCNWGGCHLPLTHNYCAGKLSAHSSSALSDCMPIGCSSSRRWGKCEAFRQRLCSVRVSAKMYDLDCYSSIWIRIKTIELPVLWGFLFPYALIKFLELLPVWPLKNVSLGKQSTGVCGSNLLTVAIPKFDFKLFHTLARVYFLQEDFLW